MSITTESVRAACQKAAERAYRWPHMAESDCIREMADEFSKLITPLVEALHYYDGDKPDFMSSIPARTALAKFEQPAVAGRKDGE